MDNKTIEEMKEMKGVQREQISDDINKRDEYMVGLYNGMEFMMSIAEKRDPLYLDLPKKEEANGPV